MMKVMVIYSLLYSAANWGVFFWSSISVTKADASRAGNGGAGHVELQGLDPDKVIAGTGKLATAFKSAGMAATAAALSLVGLVVAAIVAGIDK